MTRKETIFCVEHALLVVRAPRPALFPQGFGGGLCVPEGSFQQRELPVWLTCPPCPGPPPSE